MRVRSMSMGGKCRSWEPGVVTGRGGQLKRGPGRAVGQTRGSIHLFLK